MSLLDLIPNNKRWEVVWDEKEWIPISTLNGIANLIEFSFNFTENDIGFICKCSDGRKLIHYFNKIIIYEGTTGVSSIANLLHERYGVVLGVSFTDNKSAENFIDGLEKRYMWKILQE